MASDAWDELTLLQQRFVDAYMGEANGNGVKACRLAGYKGQETTLASQASTNIRLPKIRAALDARIENDPLTVGRVERQRMLSRIARGEMKEEPGITPIRTRMDALDMLARSQGESIAHVQVGGSLELTSMPLAKLLALYNGQSADNEDDNGED